VGTKAALFPSFALLPSVADNTLAMATKCEFTSPNQSINHNFYIHTVHLDTIKVFYLPTDTQLNRLQNNFNIYIQN
jgi:hypothetical protein